MPIYRKDGTIVDMKKTNNARVAPKADRLAEALKAATPQPPPLAPPPLPPVVSDELEAPEMELASEEAEVETELLPEDLKPFMSMSVAPIQVAPGNKALRVPFGEIESYRQMGFVPATRQNGLVLNAENFPDYVMPDGETCYIRTGQDTIAMICKTAASERLRNSITAKWVDRQLYDGVGQLEKIRK